MLKSLRQPGLSFARVVTLVLCCLLLLFMTVEVAHTHGADTAAHCQLCLAAHVALQSPVVAAALLLLAMFTRVAMGEAARGFARAGEVRRIRPPPVLSARARKDLLKASLTF